jgi:hypothetical protein
MAKAHRRRRRGFSLNRRRKTRRARTNPYFLNRPRRRSRRRLSTNPRRRRHTMRANPPRRRARRYSSNRRRSYRRNPALSVMGFQLPNLMDVAAVAGGMIVPPIISGYIMGWLPASLQTSSAAKWAVKAAAVVLPSMAVRSFISRRAGNLMLLGGSVSFVLDLIKEFAPGVIPGVGYQPLLGAFTASPAFGARARLPLVARAPSRMLSSTPDRLDPMQRF